MPELIDDTILYVRTSQELMLRDVLREADFTMHYLPPPDEVLNNEVCVVG